MRVHISEPESERIETSIGRAVDEEHKVRLDPNDSMPRRVLSSEATSVEALVNERELAQDGRRSSIILEVAMGCEPRARDLNRHVWCFINPDEAEAFPQRLPPLSPLPFPQDSLACHALWKL
ncbi:uncharacterized protein PV07_09932 [Cladophialophora immunda]|uniref:Uncharacterized protein n=1 Tax=Cladophialophora immunda TaxID=569365 RepID=A0A0D2CKX4_9EURO|nr:uncharacterized protein PV07_09932 [Cladophialophora immunda]KIW24204.1 hypothetical protein PV07_09932 [Cladophialophora immunda]